MIRGAGAGAAGLLSALAVLASPANAAQVSGPQDCVGGPAAAREWTLAIEVVQTILPPSEAAGIMQNTMVAMLGQMKQAMSPDLADPGLQALFDRKVESIPARIMPVVGKHIPSLTNAMACAYVGEFTLNELLDLNAFAKTPSGRRYLSRSAALMADPSVAAANQAYMADVRPVFETFMLEIREEVSAYMTRKPGAR